MYTTIGRAYIPHNDTRVQYTHTHVRHTAVVSAVSTDARLFFARRPFLPRYKFIGAARVHLCAPYCVHVERPRRVHRRQLESAPPLAGRRGTLIKGVAWPICALRLAKQVARRLAVGARDFCKRRAPRGLVYLFALGFCVRRYESGGAGGRQGGGIRAISIRVLPVFNLGLPALREKIVKYLKMYECRACFRVHVSIFFVSIFNDYVELWIRFYLIDQFVENIL